MGRAEVDADGVKGGLRAAQHHRRRAANEGIRPVFRHEIAAYGQGSAAGDGPDQNQGSGLRRNADPAADRRQNAGQQVHGSAGPEHVDRRQ